MTPSDLRKVLSDYFSTQPVLKAYLFGSYAKLSQTQASDIDILIELDPEVPIGMEYVQMYLDLKRLTGKEVDLVTEKSLSPYIRKDIEKEMKLVYER
ncbi:MAG: nucleotidyltransferase family protein [Cyclobacteriaceae bacterium]